MPCFCANFPWPPKLFRLRPSRESVYRAVKLHLMGFVRSSFFSSKTLQQGPSKMLAAISFHYFPSPVETCSLHFSINNVITLSLRYCGARTLTTCQGDNPLPFQKRVDPHMSSDRLWYSICVYCCQLFFSLQWSYSLIFCCVSHRECLFRRFSWLSYHLAAIYCIELRRD
jgi:hypothetical protein